MPDPASDSRLAPRLVALEAAVVILALLLAWWMNLPLIPVLHPTPSAVLLAMVATLPMLALMYWIGRSRWKPFAGLMREVDGRIAPLFAGSSLVHLAAIAVAAGIAEELLFRGVLQQWLEVRIGTIAAMVGAAVLFGLAHAITRTYAAVAAAIGLYLGWLLAVTGNLVVPIVTHALYDFAALWYLVHRETAPLPVPNGNGSS